MVIELTVAVVDVAGVEAVDGGIGMLDVDEVEPVVAELSELLPHAVRPRVRADATAKQRMLAFMDVLPPDRPSLRQPRTGIRHERTSGLVGRPRLPHGNHVGGVISDMGTRGPLNYLSVART